MHGGTVVMLSNVEQALKSTRIARGVPLFAASFHGRGKWSGQIRYRPLIRTITTRADSLQTRCRATRVPKPGSVTVNQGQS